MTRIGPHEQESRTQRAEETPDTMHGRLMEAFHISGYTFERACTELGWLLEEDRWQRVGGGYNDIDDFLATFDLSKFKLAVEQRKQIAQRLASLRASQRATARMLGVHHSTVAKDLDDGGNPPRDVTALTGEDADSGGNPPASASLPWTSDPAVDPARDAETRSRRRQKEEHREDRREENRRIVAAAPSPEVAVENARFSTIVIDPPWDWGDEGDVDQFGRARPTYATMSMEELQALPLDRLADDDAHIYLWITNRSLPKGFALLDAWGFRYITCLTWCKPSFGMGNYFRGQTEQVLFGVRGSQPLKRKDVGTWFAAPRGPDGHSSKPVAFYALVESCSPGPYLEMFARSNRDGWVGWGAETATVSGE